MQKKGDNVKEDEIKVMVLRGEEGLVDKNQFEFFAFALDD